MASTFFSHALAVLLALALAYAAVDDWRRRIIENWLTGGIAAAAPLWWWAQGMPIWPDAPIQIGIAIAVFLLFMIFFVIRAMGGGDVKLIGALALWFPVGLLSQFLMVMAIAGGVLTLIMMALHRIQKKAGAIEVPYGVAIAGAGLWAILPTIF